MIVTTPRETPHRLFGPFTHMNRLSCIPIRWESTTCPQLAASPLDKLIMATNTCILRPLLIVYPINLSTRMVLEDQKKIELDHQVLASRVV
jgi:hypothetical protein